MNRKTFRYENRNNKKIRIKDILMLVIGAAVIAVGADLLVDNATIVAKHATDDACGDKVGVIVGHAGNAGVKVENCSAANSTVTAGRDAGQIVGAAKTANLVGCTATNVTVTAGGDCTGANINNAIIGRTL